ncbi:hypothetical protein GCM10012285_23870 [Streptomyces kronopolitis]|uniref:DUF4267 domain-containing protein n=1 Tax=Streptomyces kronopolitis TaxID=1612435 RepID=A0ABQ2JB32_9ACTN|nr:hypothetical protein [Streptomyces kronopolitis]GGN42977.1 hypothetical protein GCM10012285_23870 [Streptomyces kronopolitis]
MKVSLLRAVGVATAAYGVAVAAAPGLLARPSGLAGDGGRTAPEVRTSLRPLAWRDAVSGLAMALAPDGPALRTAAYVRIAADFGDAVLLGATLPGRARRVGAVAVSVGWGALSVAGLLADGQKQEARKGPTRPRGAGPRRG